MLGNERMISHWPARGGPVVMDDIVYYAGGIWPSDGVFIYALEATTGAEVWKNTESGGIRMAQPHGGAEAVSGVAPQGYLVARGNDLLVPTGRAVPAMFDLADGKLRYYQLAKNQQLQNNLVTTQTVAQDSLKLSGEITALYLSSFKDQGLITRLLSLPANVVKDAASLSIVSSSDRKKVEAELMKKMAEIEKKMTEIQAQNPTK